ncbi:hypothetical protein PMI11_03530 [Rhizobium sp. CF142]|nr:hypothetical protein PMI11_03530 [Rhizobium sp. CF142]
MIFSLLRSSMSISFLHDNGCCPVTYHRQSARIVAFSGSRFDPLKRIKLEMLADPRCRPRERAVEHHDCLVGTIEPAGMAKESG